MGKFVLSAAKKGYKFNLVAGNGETIATSQIYASIDTAKNGIASVMKNAPIAAVEDQTVKGFKKEGCPKFEIYQDKKGEYRFPGAFIGLFETNGFIIKLDKFIYIEVLKYLSHASERGEKVVPIAVNVSRVTATDPDFLDFYIGNKRKYGIGDGFITLELTESFAVENYERIEEIVAELHQNGIRCSMDDFGSGYSSFNILKQVTFDELKLDRLFLTPGKDPKRSDAIIRTVIRLAHDLGISVVQEGVETEEMFNSVLAMGCEVVQGYYYAKAISLEEFRVFVATNTSIKYKAKVK